METPNALVILVSVVCFTSWRSGDYEYLGYQIDLRGKATAPLVNPMTSE